MFFVHIIVISQLAHARDYTKNYNYYSPKCIKHICCINEPRKQREENKNSNQGSNQSTSIRQTVVVELKPLIFLRFILIDFFRNQYCNQRTTERYYKVKHITISSLY